MSFTEPPIELLILDFAGVCTPAHHDLLDVAPTEGVVIRPGIVELVATAAERDTTVVILSNEISTDWALTEDLFGCVDQVISCADNKIWKPDRRAFQRCLLSTGRRAEHTLVVDDEVDNITVARSLGMQVFHFDVDEPEASLKTLRGRFA